MTDHSTTNDERESAALVGHLLERAFREGYVAGEQDARRVADKEPFLGPTRCWERSKAHGWAEHLNRTAERLSTEGSP